MDNLYIKRKDNGKKRNITIDARLYDMASKLLEYNPNCVFAISKVFEEKSDGALGKELETIPCIVVNMAVNTLMIPSCFKLLPGNYLTTWCDNDPSVKLERRKIMFKDGNIKEKTIKDLYLKIK